VADRVAMTDDGWTSTVAFDDLADGRGVRVTVDDVGVLLVRSGEQLYAIGSRCTHQGAPLDRGPLRLTGSDPTVTCPAHGSVFRLQDGKVARGPAARPEPSFDTRVADGIVQLRPQT
jgi:nitrite reductase/ring-hydroxylating ferredoxin subunit